MRDTKQRLRLLGQRLDHLLSWKPDLSLAIARDMLRLARTLPDDDRVPARWHALLGATLAHLAAHDPDAAREALRSAGPELARFAQRGQPAWAVTQEVAALVLTAGDDPPAAAASATAAFRSWNRLHDPAGSARLLLEPTASLVDEVTTLPGRMAVRRP